MTLNLSLADWLALFAHFASLSLLAVGGAIATAPEMHRFLVDGRHWLTEAQFTSSIAIAQAARPTVCTRTRWVCWACWWRWAACCCLPAC